MANATSTDIARKSDWRRLPEVGTVLGIRFVVALSELFGRALATAFLWFLALYYAVASSRARGASKAWLGRIGEPTTFGRVVRHLHSFARVSLDRLFFLRGRLEPFVVRTNGEHYLADLAERRVGAVLLGAHLGSFEAMRAQGRFEQLRLAVVVDTRSAERLGRVLRELDPRANIDVIGVDPDGVATALRVREAIRRGDLVGILADRRAADDARNVTVDFLGAPAAFPVGPFLLAHTLKCPVFQVFGLFSAPNVYELHCEPFAETVTLERHGREASLKKYVQAYADRLAHYARKAPYNWFNLYDFWRE
ncbi:MAG TPA: hypothetical protein VM580_09905 [Labilithrix sp.]|nr:hypothetical protein [Labilithrix sp.]